MSNTAGAIRAGRAFVELFTEQNPMIRGLDQASKKFKSWGKTLTTYGTKLAVGGFGIGAGIFALTKTFADAGSQIDDTAQRTGVAAESLSELKYAAEQNGAGIEDLEAGFRNLSKFMVEVAKGGEEDVAILDSLGISLAVLQGLSPDRQLELLAGAIAGIQDPALKAVTAMKLFGKSGTQLIPLINNGTAGIAALRAEARRLGQVMSNEDATAAAEMGDAFDRLWGGITSVRNAIASSFTPTVRALADTLTNLATTIGKWVRDNRELANTIIAVTAGLAIAGAAFYALGVAISVASVAMTAISTIFTVVSSGFALIATVVAGIPAALTAVVGVFATIGSAIVALPTLIGAGIGSVVAAFGALGAFLVSWPVLIAAGVAAFVYFSGAGTAAMNAIGSSFKSAGKWVWALLGDAQQVFKGIVDAIAAGNIEKAWKIVTTVMEIGWLTALEAIKDAWGTMSDFLVGAMEVPIRAITTELAAFSRELRELAGIDIGADGLESLDQFFKNRKRQRERNAVNRSQDDPTLIDARGRLRALLAPAPVGAPTPNVRKLGLGADAADATANAAKEIRFGTTGTFNARAVAGLGNQGAMAKTAKNTEATAKNTKETVKKLGKLKPLAFGA